MAEEKKAEYSGKINRKLLKQLKKKVSLKRLSRTNKYSSVVQEYLIWSDLEALDSSPSAIRTAFQNIYGTQPDGIALNNTTYYDAVQPPITEQYGQYCYKIAGDAQYSTGATDEEEQAIVGSGTAVNGGTTEATMTVSVEGTWTDSATATSSITTGMSWSTSIGLEGVFEMGMSFNMDVTVGQSVTQTTSRTQTTSVQVKVPANSTVKVNMVAIFKKETMDYTMPINCSGSLGANFPKRVGDNGGAYFWFVPLVTLTNGKTYGEISGKIDGVMGVDTVIDIQPAEPISK